MRLFLKFSAVVLVCAMIALPGCGSSDSPGENAAAGRQVVKSQPKDELKRPNNTNRIGLGDLKRQLASRGLETSDMGPPSISIDDSSRFPEEPRSTLVLKVSDGQGNASPMTFIEFSSWKAAAALDAKPINGFAVRNWFVLGTTNNYFVKRVTEALDG